jgi:(4S)-4-hydroxy-5-phosphonooxypentane-2,3-dione isomerase
MAYVVTAIWRAKEGEEEAIERILHRIVPIFRAEPACRQFVAHRSLDDPRTFFLYEQYDDEAGFQAHAASETVRTDVLGDAVPRLEERVRALYETLE